MRRYSDPLLIVLLRAHSQKFKTSQWRPRSSSARRGPAPGQRTRRSPASAAGAEARQVINSERRGGKSCQASGGVRFGSGNWPLCKYAFCGRPSREPSAEVLMLLPRRMRSDAPFCQRIDDLILVCLIEMTLPEDFSGGIRGDGTADERWGAVAARGAAGFGSAPAGRRCRPHRAGRRHPSWLQRFGAVNWQFRPNSAPAEKSDSGLTTTGNPGNVGLIRRLPRKRHVVSVAVVATVGRTEISALCFSRGRCFGCSRVC
jgi:hypothetical protein